MTMLRVCHISTVHQPFDTRVFRKECRSLAEIGYDVHLVVQGEDCEVDGVRIHGLRGPKGRYDRISRLVHEAYKMALTIDADIYHVHDPELLIIADSLKKSGRWVVFDSHESYSFQIAQKPYLPIGFKKIAALIYEQYETSICKKIDAVVMPCTFDGENPFEGRARKTCFIDNLPIVDKDHEVDFSRSKRDAICYIGKITHARGVTNLVKAAHLANVRLILCGQVEDEYLSELLHMPQGSCIDYRGILDAERVNGVIEECFCGSAALLDMGQYWHEDNMPTKAWEYLMGGIPFIYNTSPYGLRFQKKYPCCINVNPEDINSYAAAIVMLKENKELAERMAKIGYDAIVDCFNWNNEAKKLDALYQEIVKNYQK